MPLDYAATLLAVDGSLMIPTSKSLVPDPACTELSISTAIVDVFVSIRRNLPAVRKLFKTTLFAHDEPVKIVADLVQALEMVVEE